MLRYIRLERRSRTWMPATLLPFSSRAGAKIPTPIRVGTTPMMPPPTPLLAGMPTRMAKSPHKDEMGDYDPEEILFVVQGELEYTESLDDEWSRPRRC